MDAQMSCSQCGQAARLRDELTGALIGLVRAADSNPEVNADTWRLVIEGLFTTAGFDGTAIRALIDRVREEKARLAPDCAVCPSTCGRTGDYDVSLLRNAPENVRSLKTLILLSLRGMAAYAHHAMVLGYTDEEVNYFFAKALFAVGEDWDADELLRVAMEVGEKDLRCRALLDRADTEGRGTPAL